jgi:outer membrane protein assembly factor BamB
MKHARSLVAALLVLLAALCGCAGERSGLPSTASLAWTYRGHALLSPIASESDATVLVAAESPTRLIALNASDGRELWSVEAGGRTVLCGGGVTLAQRAPSFTREPAEVVALDTRTGKELWRTSRWRAWPAPRLQSGLAVGFTVDRTFEAVDARTGERIFAFDPAPNRVAAPKPPYSEDPADVDFWSASALTASGKLAYRGPEASFAVVDLRAGRVVEIPAPEMGYRTGIVAVGERVVVVGGSPGADEYRVDAFDAAAGTMLWSKRVAGRRAERVGAGPGETVVLLDAATADYGGPTVRAYAEHVYDAATGEELGPEPFEVRKRDSLHLGGPFGELAVLRDAPSLRA